MESKQKNRIEFIKKVSEVQETFKEKAHKRVLELLLLRHKLAKEIIQIRDEIAIKRFKERQSLLKGKKNETTLY